MHKRRAEMARPIEQLVMHFFALRTHYRKSIMNRGKQKAMIKGDKRIPKCLMGMNKYNNALRINKPKPTKPIKGLVSPCSFKILLASQLANVSFVSIARVASK